LRRFAQIECRHHLRTSARICGKDSSNRPHCDHPLRSRGTVTSTPDWAARPKPIAARLFNMRRQRQQRKRMLHRILRYLCSLLFKPSFLHSPLPAFPLAKNNCGTFVHTVLE
jgi:hypothetical protein